MNISRIVSRIASTSFTKWGGATQVAARVGFRYHYHHQTSGNLRNLLGDLNRKIVSRKKHSATCKTKMRTDYNVNGFPVTITEDLTDSHNDAVVIVYMGNNRQGVLDEFLASAQHHDKGFEKHTSVILCPMVAGNRLVVAPTGRISPYDDIRSLKQAAKAGIERAIEAGSTNPILVLQPYDNFTDAEFVILLGALEATYVPLQMREFFPKKASKLVGLSVYNAGVTKDLDALLKTAVSMEKSLGVSRDIGGGDPERMCPQSVVDYLEDTFRGTDVKMRVIDDVKTFEKEYPLYAAVNRAANAVPRHRGRIVFLEYAPSSYEETVVLLGKGVTYDTGGADVKVSGSMIGMSRDKCGAAAVAGFLKSCELLKPKIKVIAVMSMVRNSIGEESYVADELILSRSGKSVRIGNTDAEGRMIMADLLLELKERALKEKNAHIYTIATLTGHAVRTVGNGYSIIMDNHVAREKCHSAKFRQAGESIGDMVEISTIRREDLKTHKGQTESDDVLQALSQPSTACGRGHQGPAGFLLLTSGLNEGPVAYSHIDIAASAGSFPGPPTGAPILALAKLHKVIQI